MKRAAIFCIVGILILSAFMVVNVENQATGERSRVITNNSQWLIVPDGEELTLHGVHSYSEGVIIDGILNVTPYDGSGGTTKGTLTLNAPGIEIDGIVDASGRGYGGGGGGGGAAYNYAGAGGLGGTGGNGGDGGDGKLLYSGGGGGGSNGGLGGQGYDPGDDGSVDGGGDGGISINYNTAGIAGLGFGSGGGGGSGGYLNFDNHSGGGGGGGGGTGGADGTLGVVSIDDAVRKGGDGGNGAGPYGGKGGKGKTYNDGGMNGMTGWFGVYVYSKFNIYGNGDKSTDLNVGMGSGGGGGAGSALSYGGGGGGGGAGGGAIILNATTTLNITGSVLAKSAPMSYGGRDGGGYGREGGGGGIALRGYNLNIIEGIINVESGSGYGSGTIKIFRHNYYNSGEMYYGGSYGRIYYGIINDKPVAKFFTDSNITNKDQSIELSAEPSTDPDDDPITHSYFDFGDNTTSGWRSGLKVSHSYEFSGDYIVELKVRDNFGAESDPITAAIHVNYPPTAQLTAEPAAGKVNELITFSIGNSEDIDGEIAEYYLDFGDKTVSDWINDSMAYHMYTNVGAYYVDLRVKDNNNAISENNEYVRVDITEEGTPIAGKPPVAVLNVDSNTTYSNVNMMFDASSSYDEDGKVSEYYFDFGDGEISGWLLTPKTYHAFSMAGSYDVYLYVKDNTNLVSYTSIELQVELNQPPTPVFLSEPQYIGNSVFLMWTQNTDDDFYAYEVHASLISNFTPNLNTLRNIITDQPTPQCTLENVIKGYLYRVRVIDTGGYTADSNIVPTLGEGVAPPSEEVSDKTTVTFSMSYIAGSNTFISEETYIILRAPQDFPNAMIYYNIDNLGDNEYQGMFQLDQTTEGKHTLIYWSTAENWTEADQYKTIIYDASSPNLIITNPKDGNMIMNSSVEVYWDGSDNCGIKTYYIRLDDGNWIEAKENKYTLTKISDGEHIIYVKAEDNLGHSTIQTVKIKLDLSSPEVTLLSPTDGMHIETGNDIEVSWIASDKDAGINEILLSIDGVQHSLSVDSESYTISNPSEGTHVIVLKVKDNAGNINAASTSFMVAEKEAAEDEDDDLAVWGMFIIMIIILILIALIFIKTLKPKRQEPEKAEEPEPEPPSEITAPSSETPPPSEESPQPPPQPQPEPKPAAVQPVEQRTSTESTPPQQPPKPPQSPQSSSAPKIVQKTSIE